MLPQSLLVLLGFLAADLNLLVLLLELLSLDPLLAFTSIENKRILMMQDLPLQSKAEELVADIILILMMMKIKNANSTQFLNQNF